MNERQQLVTGVAFCIWADKLVRVVFPATQVYLGVRASSFFSTYPAGMSCGTAWYFDSGTSTNFSITYGLRDKDAAFRA